jgi:hypothetical protein
MTTRQADRIAYNADLLEAARARDAGRPAFIGEIEAYCTNARCSVRYITLTIKELDGLTPPAFSCPSCRRPAKLHHVLTLAEAEARHKESARISVNAQLYQDSKGRSTGHPDDGFILIPLLFDGRLPTVERLQALERGEWD